MTIHHDRSVIEARGGELIARLQSATKGNTELSALIERDIMGRMVHDWPLYFRTMSFDGRENSAIRPVTPYTTSLDAALMLVPDGMCWCVNSANPPNEYRAEVDWQDGVWAATAPLSLCIAALRARR